MPSLPQADVSARTLRCRIKSRTKSKKPAQRGTSVALLTLAMFQLQGKTIRMICQGHSQLSLTPRTCWWCREGSLEKEKPRPCSGQGQCPCLQRNTPGVSRMLSTGLPTQLLPTMFTPASADWGGSTRCLPQTGNVTARSLESSSGAGQELWEEPLKESSDPTNLPLGISSHEFRCPCPVLGVKKLRVFSLGLRSWADSENKAICCVSPFLSSVSKYPTRISGFFFSLTNFMGGK